MKKFIISLALGAAAGVIDCVPMLLQKLDANSIASAFIQCWYWGLLSAIPFAGFPAGSRGRC